VLQELETSCLLLYGIQERVLLLGTRVQRVRGGYESVTTLHLQLNTLACVLNQFFFIFDFLLLH